MAVVGGDAGLAQEGELAHVLEEAQLVEGIAEQRMLDAGARRGLAHDRS